MPPRAPRQEKREYFGAKFLPTTIEALNIMAVGENRSLSNMAETIILEWFRDHRPEILASAVKDLGATDRPDLLDEPKG